MQQQLGNGGSKTNDASPNFNDQSNYRMLIMVAGENSNWFATSPSDGGGGHKNDGYSRTNGNHQMHQKQQQ